MVHGKNFLNGLDLHDDAISDDQIDPVRGIQFDSSVNDWQRDFGFKRKLPLVELVSEASLVRTF
jgi:hypothetical protein